MALLDAAALTPHGFCLAWNPTLLTVDVASDATIALAYYSIPISFSYLLLRRRDLVFPWVFALFAVFITACGTTHVMDIWTLWRPDYQLQGAVKALTALASIATAAALWPLVPRILQLPSPTMLRDANEQLAAQVRERDTLVEALRVESAERERIEGMLRQAQKMEAIGQLTGGVAHDFNNLLLVVQANLELLQRRLPEAAPQHILILRALEAADRGSSLTQQLLAFSRRQSLQPTLVDVDALVDRMDTILRSTLSDNVTLELRLSGALPSVEADPHQLESALLNLVINARDAMPDGGSLRIETSSEHVGAMARHDQPPELASGDYVCISVTDTGLGMTPEVQRAAFEPFFTTKPIGQGSGLGLSQVYGFAKQSQGHVTLSSQTGTGTMVRLFLPAAAHMRGRTAQPALQMLG